MKRTLTSACLALVAIPLATLTWAYWREMARAMIIGDEIMKKTYEEEPPSTDWTYNLVSRDWSSADITATPGPTA